MRVQVSLRDTCEGGCHTLMRVTSFAPHSDPLRAAAQPLTAGHAGSPSYCWVNSSPPPELVSPHLIGENPRLGPARPRRAETWTRGSWPPLCSAGSQAAGSTRGEQEACLVLALNALGPGESAAEGGGSSGGA